MESSSMARSELVAFAESRGGRLLSGEDTAHPDAHPDAHPEALQYALVDVLRWRCALNHEFEASPRLLIRGGYWCPECFPSAHEGRGWDWASQAKVDPLLARFYRTG